MAEPLHRGDGRGAGCCAAGAPAAARFARCDAGRRYGGREYGQRRWEPSDLQADEQADAQTDGKADGQADRDAKLDAERLVRRGSFGDAVRFASGLAGYVAEHVARRNAKPDPQWVGRHAAAGVAIGAAGRLAQRTASRNAIGDDEPGRQRRRVRTNEPVRAA